jgi:hypothetical protein
MSTKSLILAMLLPFTTATSILPREDICNPCNPSGASGTNPPSFGPDLQSLYTDLLASVKDIKFQSRAVNSLNPRADGFCCRETLDCVNVQSLNIPMCYDKFTTNYAFADGSYGSLTTGDYTQGSAQANLISGQYTKDGQAGNIYAGDESAKPNTATLSIPPQYTGTGKGGPIPASELASVIVVTTEIGGTTISGGPTTVPAWTTLGTTISAHTVTGTAPTTIEPATIVATTTPSLSSAAQHASAPSASSTGGAAVSGTYLSRPFGVSLLTALLYGIF